MELRHGACYESSSRRTQSGSWGMRVHDGSVGLAVVGAVVLLSLMSAVTGIRRGTGNCVGNDACAGKDWRVCSTGSGDRRVVRRRMSESSRRQDDRRGGVGIVRGVCRELCRLCRYVFVVFGFGLERALWRREGRGGKLLSPSLLLSSLLAVKTPDAGAGASLSSSRMESYRIPRARNACACISSSPLSCVPMETDMVVEWRIGGGVERCGVVE